MLQLQFLDLLILTHLQRNLLMEDLPWTLNQLFFRLVSLLPACLSACLPVSRRYRPE
jgi:hypothetical protein